MRAVPDNACAASQPPPAACNSIVSLAIAEAGRRAASMTSS